ncbi:MAG: Rrf2 family transcriptional regulator [Spirochaetia bacterium]|nr:Rrf2 family transcriptional regulator [Spirochaetia bacterium]
MHLSTKGRYGTRAIIEIAKNYGQKPIKRKEIVEAQQVPDSYIENILITLKTAGLIQTIRGAHGGYRLAKAPSEITILEVVEALEGSIMPIPCLEESSGYCGSVDTCATRPIWHEMYLAMREVLIKYTLEDIIRREQDTPVFAYTI